MAPGRAQAICRRAGPGLRRTPPTTGSARGSSRFRRASWALVGSCAAPYPHGAAAAIAGSRCADVHARPCKPSGEAPQEGRAGQEIAVYPWIGPAWLKLIGRRGENMMQPAVFAAATLAFAIFAAPVTAQPMPPGQSLAVVQQTGAGEPSPAAQSTPEAPQAQPEPPPFPPMPRAKPSHRWTTSNHHVATGHHSTTQAHHRTTSAHHRTTSTHSRATHAARRSAHATHRRSHERKEAVHLSRKTIRQCHGMSYRQIMRNSNCRALMSQELEAASARHQSKHRHSATQRHKAAKKSAHHSKHHRS